jgi:hypothetical protein
MKMYVINKFYIKNPSVFKIRRFIKGRFKKRKVVDKTSVLN